MKTVTSQLSFPQLLVPVSATRARIDLEVLYSPLKSENNQVQITATKFNTNQQYSFGRLSK